MLSTGWRTKYNIIKKVKRMNKDETTKQRNRYPLIVDNGNNIQFLERETKNIIGGVNKSYFDMAPKNEIINHPSALVKDAYYCYKGCQEFDKVRK